MKKMILAISLVVAVAGMAFAASCYKYHYVLTVHCEVCNQYQELEVDRDTNAAAQEYGRKNFSNHSKDCKRNGGIHASIKAKDTNNYTVCD